LEGYKTIKELADELSVSKHIVKYQVDKLSSDLVLKRNNRLYISVDGQNEVKNLLNISSKNSKKSEEISEEFEENIDTKAFLNKELFEEIIQKNKQIEELHGLLNSQQKLLDQQQQLTLQSNKQIESLQQQLLLSNQSDEKEEETSDTIETPEDQSETLEETVHEEIKSESQKWWQFWKSKKTN